MELHDLERIYQDQIAQEVATTDEATLAERRKRAHAAALAYAEMHTATSKAVVDVAVIER